MMYMKRIKMERKSLMLFFACIFSLTVSSENVTIDGLKYYLYTDTHEAAINYGSTCSGELVIPSEVTYNGEKFIVNGIRHDAFQYCTELTKVRIPKTIDHVIHHVLTDDPEVGGAVSPDCMNPFTGCTALESIEVDKDNPCMKSVGGVLFSKDGTALYSYPGGMRQEEYKIPETVTWIGCGAFSKNPYLSALTMPNSVTRVSSGVCSDCVNMKTVRLSENITYIEAYSFDKCESMKILDIPESIQGFGESVFRWTHFEKIVIRGTFPNGLRDDTFYFMDDATILYVQPSEIEKFKKVKTFHGTVLPLEEYTDVKQIELHQLSGSVYDLQGRRLDGQPINRGIYIQNGKKVVVK